MGMTGEAPERLQQGGSEESPFGVTPGSRLGPHEVVAKIGEGGYGEDTRLRRNRQIRSLDRMRESSEAGSGALAGRMAVLGGGAKTCCRPSRSADWRA